MTVRWTVRAADRARRSELSAKLTERADAGNFVKILSNSPLYLLNFGFSSKNAKKGLTNGTQSDISGFNISTE